VTFNKIIKEQKEIEIKFPYIAWWSSDKEKILKIDIINDYNYYYLRCIEIQNGFSIQPYLHINRISINKNVIDSDINEFIRDYDIIASLNEFEEFKEKTLKLFI
jgi:hypothetical protein